MSEKYISASKLKVHYSWLGKDATLSPKDVDDIVDAQAAADVAEVVRCKDCRYFDVTQTYLCDMHHRAANEDDYCSYGIRKMDSEKEGAE